MGQITHEDLNVKLSEEIKESTRLSESNKGKVEQLESLPSELSEHIEDKENPHSLTASQVGAVPKQEFEEHVLKIASETELGHIKVDGKTIKVDPVTGFASANGIPYAIATWDTATSSYLVDIVGITEYQEGMAIAVKIATTNPSAATININNLGEKGIFPQSNSQNVQAGYILNNYIYTLSYNGRFFVLQGGGTLLNNTLTSTSTTEAATANAVKMVNDKLEGVKVDTRGLYHIAIGDRAGSVKKGEYGISIGLLSDAQGESSFALGTQVVSLNDKVAVLGSNSSGFAPSVWQVPGSFSVSGTKNFEIPHPNPDKKHTHVIRHGAVESPTTGDTLYRYKVEVATDGEIVEVQLPDYFEHLNTNVDVWVNPHEHFGRAFGKVVGDKLYVTCEKAGVYKALVIGTRNDDNVQDWYIKGVEREIGESWEGETYVFEVDEILEISEFKEEL